MMGLNKPLTLEERKQIEALFKTDLSCSRISKKIGRGKNTVVNEARKAGGRELYRAESAHNLSLLSVQEGYEKLRARNESNKVTFKFKQRIEHLEMQIEILHETLKELMKK